MGLARAAERAREAEVSQAVLVAELADAYGVVDQPGGPVLGGERLVTYGADGTPEIAEFLVHEVGPALGVSPAAAGHLIGDVLDLRHRLPRLWVHVRNGHVRVWVARKVAQLTRRASPAVADGVDRHLAPLAPGWAPGRIITQAQNLLVHLDPDTAEAEQARRRAHRGVGFAADGNGLRRMWASLDGAAALDLEATIDRLATTLRASGAPDPDAPRCAHPGDDCSGGACFHPGRSCASAGCPGAGCAGPDEERLTADRARARALELLADPARAADLLDPGVLGPLRGLDHEAGADPGPHPGGRPRPVADIEVRIDASQWGESATAEVTGLGAVLAGHLAGLLDGRDVHLRPVIDTRI